MDSFISAIVLSICRNVFGNTLISGNFDSPEEELVINLNKEAEFIHIPLMNCKRGELKTRLDINYLMKKFEINEEDLFYVNDEDVLNDLNNSNSSIILVDHNVLNPSQSNYSDRVVEIYDHHFDNSSEKIYKNLTKKNIIYPLGSCSTLILLENFIIDQSHNKILFKIFDPLFLISALLLDSDIFKQELYENRWVNMDFYVYKKIIDGNFKSCDVDSFEIQEFYNKLSNAKFDEDMNLSLGVENLMDKDKKSFKWGEIICEWSSLQVPLKSITKMYGWNSVINYFENSKLKIENVSLYLTLSKYTRKEENYKILTIYDFNRKIEFLDFSKFCEVEFGEKLKNLKLKKNLENKIIKIYFDQIFSRKLLEPILSKYFNK
jgi:hypothetical protein